MYVYADQSLAYIVINHGAHRGLRVIRQLIEHHDHEAAAGVRASSRTHKPAATSSNAFNTNPNRNITGSFKVSSELGPSRLTQEKPYTASGNQTPK